MIPHSPNKVIARAEKTIEEAGAVGQIIFILRVGDQITIRDNSGHAHTDPQGLTQDVLALLERLFP
jgi:hypothetical protein